MNELNETRIIKRYQNRKLYDTLQSCYVTLEEIAQIVRDGNEIKVIDNKTKSDITYSTQIQLLFDQERKSLQNGDTELLKRVIKSDKGTLTGYIKNLEEGFMNPGHLKIASEHKEVSHEVTPSDAAFASSFMNKDLESVETTTLN